MQLLKSSGAVLLMILAQTASVAPAQTLTLAKDPLKGLSSVSVQVVNNSFDAAFKTDVESRLRQAGLRIVESDQQAQGGFATLWVETIADGSAASVRIQLLEPAILSRDDGSSPARRTVWVTSWQRSRIFQAAQSAQEIIAPFMENPLLARAFYESEQTGILSPLIKQLMPTLVDLQVRAAQRPNLKVVRDYANAFVGDFISEWLASNPKVR